MYPKKELAQLVISACKFFDVKTVVISPGSRNAPLTIGFSNLEGVEALSVVDERCAAFFAMGIAQQTQNPVVIVCTSGSALLNYYPAIAEAFYSKIPLIVISADRPKHLIDIGDGQTIRQENVFQNHILYSANLIEDDGLIEENSNLITTAIQTSIIKKGPVHINVPFNEPIYETVEILKNYQFKTSNFVVNKKEENNVDYDQFSTIWDKAARKLILIGVNYPSEKLQEVLNYYNEDPSVLVFTETTSNLENSKFINSIDNLISKLDDEGFRKLQPDVLLTFGGMVISKRIKQFLRKYKPRHHWHIDEYTKMDTYFCLSEFIQKKPVTFLEELRKKIKIVKSDYQNFWLLENEKRVNKHKEFIESTTYSDLKVFEKILETIPDLFQIQVSNSSIIRYMQLFNINPTATVFCNRGTSGIDGSTSTAIGAAFSTTRQTVLITGDLSFFYDSNALWNTNIPNNFRIILVNNGGGGIFKIIPGPKSTNALSYFETSHNLTAKHLAEMYNFEYCFATNEIELEKNLDDFYKKSNQPKILEIFTPSDKNNVVLQQYFKSL